MSENKPSIAKALPSASLVLMKQDSQDNESASIDLFMVKRTPKAAFAPGALVFPGGVLEEVDSLVQWLNYCDLPANTGSSNEASEILAYQIAAIRETYEESGILLARQQSSEEMLDDEALKGLESQRQQLLDGSLSFLEFIAENNLVVCISGLYSFGHWITPEQSPRRFDTLFFLAKAPSNQTGQYDGGEIVECQWFPCEQILEFAKSGEYSVVFATEMNVLWISQCGSIRAALEKAQQTEPYTVTAQVEIRGEEVFLVIPEEAGYGVTESQWKL